MTNYFIIMLYIDFENPKSSSTAVCTQRLEKYECWITFLKIANSSHVRSL